MDINTRLQTSSPVVTTVMKDRDPGRNQYFAPFGKRADAHRKNEEGPKDTGSDDSEPLIDIMA